jgi:hypothetical protein
MNKCIGALCAAIFLWAGSAQSIHFNQTVGAFEGELAKWKGYYDNQPLSPEQKQLLCFMYDAFVSDIEFLMDTTSDRTYRKKQFADYSGAGDWLGAKDKFAYNLEAKGFPKKLEPFLSYNRKVSQAALEAMKKKKVEYDLQLHPISTVAEWLWKIVKNKMDQEEVGQGIQSIASYYRAVADHVVLNDYEARGEAGDKRERIPVGVFHILFGDVKFPDSNPPAGNLFDGVIKDYVRNVFAPDRKTDSPEDERGRALYYVSSRDTSPNTEWFDNTIEKLKTELLLQNALEALSGSLAALKNQATK